MKLNKTTMEQARGVKNSNIVVGCRRVSKKCPKCGSSKWAYCGSVGEVDRFGCSKCKFESFIKRKVEIDTIVVNGEDYEIENIGVM